MQHAEPLFLITPENRDAAREFFAPAEGAPWRWEDRGEVLAWRDGTTLAFTEELALIFRRLEPRRLEHFEALVAILAACRGKRWPVPETENKGLALGLSEVKAGLERLTELPKADTATPEQRAELADAVLSCQTGGGGLSANELLEIWRTDELIRRTGGMRGGASGSTVQMLLSLHAGLQRFSVERLRLRRRTGLEELPENFEEEDRPSEDLRQWLAELSAESGPAGRVARLSRRMLAALRLPARSSAGGEMTAGGLADVTMRGAPEHLLLTELAQDDDIFTARLSLGEALYRRREPETGPPEPAPAVLLDTTLRLWGAARPAAAAAALALLAARQSGNKKHRAERSLRTAVISRGMPVAMDWRTRQGLTGALEVLDAALDPLPALRAFVAVHTAARGRESGGGFAPENRKAFSRPQLNPTDGGSEIFFVTHADTVAQPQFRAALAELPPLWVAAVDAQGGFTLWRRRAHHALEPVCRARISLHGLSSAEAADASPPPALPQPGRLPLFLLQEPVPLRLPLRGKLEWAAPDPASGLAVKPERAAAENPAAGWAGLTSAGLVVHGARRNHGVVEWSQRHALGTVLAVSRREDGALVTLTAMNSRREAPVMCATGPSGEERRFAFSELPVWNLVTMDARAACFIDGANVYPRALTDGAALPPLRLPGRVRRVFPGPVCECEGGVWMRLIWNGLRVEAVRVPVPERRGTAVLAVWVESSGGLVRMLRSDGEISGPGADGGTLSLGFMPGPKAEVSIAPDGGSLLVDDAAGARHAVTLSPGLHVKRSYAAHAVFKRCGSIESPAAPGLMAHVSAAALDAENRLWVRRRNAWLRLELLVNHGPKWTLAEPPERWAREGDFLPRRLAAGVPEQQVLEHPGGALWLDARGLLHIFAWRAGVKEVTLTLTETPGAVWLSDGSRGGASFFTGTLNDEKRRVLDPADGALRELLQIWRRSGP